MLSLGIFGFRALWSPFFFLALVAILAGYFLITVKNRKRFKNSEPLTRKEGLLFSLSIILLYAIKGSPLDLLGHIAFYAHMIQMAVLYLVIPPIMILGIPAWVWRKVLVLPVIRPIFKFFSIPLIALFLFNGVFSFYHIPLIFDVVKTDMWLHAGYTVGLYIAAIFMWWPITNILNEYQSLNGLKKIGYVFANGVLITPACALIIFADTPMYSTFSDPRAWAQALELCVPYATLATLNLSGPEMFSSISLIHDQQLGGVIMKIIQEIVYGYILALIFYRWYRKDQEEASEMDRQLALNSPHTIK